MQYVNSSWTELTAVNVSAHTLSGTGLTVLGDFTAGEFSPVGYIDIKFIPEGYFVSDADPLTVSDDFIVTLASATGPDFTDVESAVVTLDANTCSGRAKFTSAPTGSYYIYVQGKAMLQTWSAYPVQFTLGGSTSYDFTTSKSQAYGGNMKQYGTKWCMYSGDTDQDGLIGNVDLTMIDNDAFNTISEHVVTDLDGDSFVGNVDLTICDNNAYNVVETMSPRVDGGGSSSSIPMVLVNGGTFTMGDATYATPLHSVTLSNFYIGITEVTQGQYKAVMSSNPSYYSSVGDNGPVEKVSWYDCISYCNKLSINEWKSPCYSISGNTSPSSWTSGIIDCDFTAKGYRLATEAEWEYAAKGGNKSAGYTYSGSNTLNDVAWNNHNSAQTHIVGVKQSNELGLFDMCGNVYEWCWDWLGSYLSSPQTNPIGAISGTNRVLRGASFFGYYSDEWLPCRRYSYDPSGWGDKVGFRVVRSF